MDIQNSSKWVEHTRWEQLLGTLVITFAAFAFRSALHPLIQPYGVFHFFIVAVLIIQTLFGYRMALVSVAISLALGEIYFVEPYGQFSNLTDKDLIISLNFILVILPAVFLLEKLQRALYARQLLGKVNDSRMLVALRRENDRLYADKKVDHSNDFIQTMLTHFDQLVLIKSHPHPAMPGPALLREHLKATGVQAWQGLLSPSDLQAIQAPLSPPDGSSQRGQRDFSLQLNWAGASHTLQGQIIHFQGPDLHVELWIARPA